MSTYTFYDGTITGVDVQNNWAVPGDLPNVTIRRGWVDTTKQNLADQDVARAMPVYEGEMLLGAFLRVDTAESTASAAVDFGVDGGTEWGADIDVTTVNAVTVSMNGYYVDADGNVTVKPNNLVAVDTGIFEVGILVTKAFDNM